MLDGKILRGLTGTPMRRMAFANNWLAEAEPEPLTFANLTTKSFIFGCDMRGKRRLEVGLPDKDEDPGKPDKGLSARGFGTAQRTDPVYLGLLKTRLHDPN